MIKSNICKIILSLLLIFVLYKSEAQVTKDTLYTTRGSFTFTIPTGVTQVTVECWGGGGRGGARTGSGAAGGGGGGAYSKKLVNVTSGNSYTVVVGAGSASSSSSVPGGNSYFQDTVTVMAKGGSSVASSQTGAVGGSAASSVGDIKRSGGTGANGSYPYYGGGGGSSAGTDSDGSNGSTYEGGTAPANGGDGGDGWSGGTRGPGFSGTKPGGGGGGALRIGTFISPGYGADGQVRITWCVPISLTGTVAKTTCTSNGTTTVMVTGNTENLPIGTYTVIYNRSSPAATGLTAIMEVTNAGVGQFTAIGFTNEGMQTVTITELQSGSCSWTISSNNSANFQVASSFNITTIDATNTCNENSTVSITSTSGNLPIGNYTVTYDRSSPVASGLTAPMTVSTAGTGTFIANGFTTTGNSTITITKLEIDSCSSTISNNNTKIITVENNYSLLSTDATNTCIGTSTVSITSTAGSLPVGEYTVTYNRSSPSATGLTASMTVSTAGIGTFIASGFTVIGNSTITITKLENGSCGSSITSNNTKEINVLAFNINGVSTTNTCPSIGETTVTLSSTADYLPVGTYTVTYNRSNPAATDISATMVVTTAGTGVFTATGFTTSGLPTITITNLQSGSCSSIISSNNIGNVAVSNFSLISTNATNSCNELSTVTLTSTASELPIGTYTVTYNRSSPAATGLTATMIVNTAGIGVFTATGFRVAGNPVITITKIESGSCSGIVSSNNTKTISVMTYRLTSTVATNSCDGTSIVTLTHSTPLRLPVGTYTVTYNISSPAINGQTATMQVLVAGSGTFTATGFSIPGNSTITIAKIENGSCWSNIIGSGNNTKTITVSTFSLTGISSSSACSSPGNSTISVTSTAEKLPVGSYIVTYDRSIPAATGLTASMSVSTAGMGSFIASGFSEIGESLITVTKLSLDTCSSNIIGNNSNTVIIQGLPSVSMGSNSPICSETILTLTSSGGNSYLWNGPNNFESTNQNPSITNATTFASGIYKVTVTDANGCANSDSLSVLIKELPMPPTNSIYNIYIGESIIIHAGTADTYLWSNYATTESINVSPIITSYYTVNKTFDGCSKSYYVKVNVLNTVSTLSVHNITICVGNSAILTATEGVSYNWSSGQTTREVIVSPTVNTTYTVTVTLSGGVTLTQSTNVFVFGNPTINLGNDENVCLGSTIELNASEGESYQWSTGETTHSINVNPSVQTDYRVTVTSSNGCRGSDEIRVSILMSPQVFSIMKREINCTSGAGIYINGSTVGVNYQLLLNGSNLGSVVAGTGTTIDFGTVSSGNYSVKAIDSSNGCESLMSGEIVIP